MIVLNDKTFNKFGRNNSLGVTTIYPDKTMSDINGLILKSAELREILHTHGAILLRDFNVYSSDEFKCVADVFIDDLMEDNGEHNPLPDKNGIYTPVSYSSKETLLWHNENSFNNVWPLIIMFGAVKPAVSGGETPIADSREVLAKINPDIINEFKKKGVMYVRTHGFGFGRTWQETYRTNNKSELEKICIRSNIEFDWIDDDCLRTKQIRPAIVKHPITNELSWFTQAQHWHPFCLKKEIRESLFKIFSLEQMPRNCYFGDGSIISDDVMQHILDAYAQVEMDFSWVRGDVMVLDNILHAHARKPYEGDRKLLVAMGNRMSFKDKVGGDMVERIK